LKKPLVSILTPLYNHSAFIGQCISSVLLQSYEKWEMLIIDDGSTDNSRQIVHSYSDARLRYYSRKHQGLAGIGDLYNYGLKLCRGELIAVLEGDDFWPSNRLKILVPLLVNSNAVVAYGFTDCVDEQSELTGDRLPSEDVLSVVTVDTLFNRPVGETARGILKSHSLWVCSVGSLIRRSSLDDIGGFQALGGGLLVDRPTFLALALKGPFSFKAETTGYWRRHKDGSTMNLGMWGKMAWGIGEYLKKFMIKHEEILEIKSSEQRVIRKYWISSFLAANVRAGRSLMLEKRWLEARQYFREALRACRPGKLLMIAILGYFLSIAHLDIEAVATINRKIGKLVRFPLKLV